MRSSAKYFFIFIIAVAVFLSIRHWLDRKREKNQDIDIVRADLGKGDSHLGSWAQKNDSTLLLLRFKRDGSFFYMVVTYPQKDSLKYTGNYKIMPSIVNNTGLRYPRMIAISNLGDTIINHFLEIKRATKQNVDILRFKTGINSEEAMLFYRIKQ